MTTVCFFCGSSMGGSDAFRSAALAIAEAAVERGLRVVYGGGRTGLMGVVADAAIARGGTVVGVIPRLLVARELAHPSLSELHVTESMTERKRLMEELSDAFIALPGGFGTLEEISEVLSWAQIGLHAKPCGFLNTEGYYDSLLAFYDRALRSGFLRPESRSLAIVESDPKRLLARVVGSAPGALEPLDAGRSE